MIIGIKTIITKNDENNKLKDDKYRLKDDNNKLIKKKSKKKN